MIDDDELLDSRRERRRRPPTNYFKVWCTRARLHHFAFFDDTSPTETAAAYNRLADLAADVGGKLSVWRPPAVRGAWNNVPLVGERS